MTNKKTSTVNPTRRNKKIGTEDSGFKNRNDFGIPDCWFDERIYWEKLKSPVIIPYSLGSYTFTIIVEPTLDDFKHFVTISDLIEVIKLVPTKHIKHIKIFLFRQSTRKDRIFSPVWGRLAYFGDYGRYKGPTIILEAQPISLKKNFKPKLTPDYQKEMRRLELDGHKITLINKTLTLRSSPQSIRNTQLYRTVFHEIGHYVDYLEKIAIPDKNGIMENGELWDLYDARPQSEKEEYAHHYATSLYNKLKGHNHLPFDPILINQNEYKEINPDWFYFSEQN